MKKIIAITAISITLASCNNTKKPQQIIEGKVTHITIFHNDTDNVFASVSIEDSAKKSINATICMADAKELLPGMETDQEPTYVRLEKIDEANNSVTFYSLKEKAVMDYDHGNPPQYTFPSDKKIIAFYLK